ncbi:MAG TPA: pilus assembly protein PilM [Candidatus Nitrosotalea sp.]|nr:pilus assembly protein PilM [Candidatus Nitrosotalea sp.]
MGTRVTKAVHLQRRGDSLNLLGYALQEAPSYDSGFSTASLAEHLGQVNQALGNRCRQVLLAVGVGESLLRNAELPMVPVSDMRVMLKFNSKNYLQQDLPDYAFDCHVFPSAAATGPESAKTTPKCRVLVGGARRQFIDDLQAATKSAGLVAEQIIPGLIGLSNAFELTHPEMFASEPVALVDIGFKNSSISLLLNGELMLNRVVAIGGDRFTTGVAEALGVSYTEAEGIKVGLPDEVQSTMVTLLSPLGRELRASIDFFEHQHDRTISQVFVSGGSARSDYINQILQTELMVPCTSWNPAGSLVVALPPEQLGELEPTTPQLTLAVGAALAAL